MKGRTVPLEIYQAALAGLNVQIENWRHLVEAQAKRIADLESRVMAMCGVVFQGQLEIQNAWKEMGKQADPGASPDIFNLPLDDADEEQGGRDALDR